jgi:peroxiredoxin
VATSPETLGEAFDRVDGSGAPLREKLSSYATAHRQLSPIVAQAYETLVDRLTRAKAGRGSPAVGDPMPPFILPDARGTLRGLAEMHAEGPLVISFNRGHWCSFCRLELRALANLEAELAQRHARMVSIVSQTQAWSMKLQEQNSLPFDVLTDMDCGYAMSLDLVIWVGQELMDVYASRGIRLPEFQGEDSWFLPIPATFVVNRQGIIVARYVDPDFRKRMDVEDVLKAVIEASGA